MSMAICGSFVHMMISLYNSTNIINVLLNQQINFVERENSTVETGGYQSIDYLKKHLIK
jgi:hypothetical protein